MSENSSGPRGETKTHSGSSRWFKRFLERRSKGNDSAGGNGKKKLKDSIWQIAVNLLAWVSVLGGLVLISIMAEIFNTDPNCKNFHIYNFYSFVDYRLWVAQVAGGIILIGVFSILKEWTIESDWKLFNRHVISDFLSVFMNFGSLFLVAGFFGVPNFISKLSNGNMNGVQDYKFLLNIVLGIFNLLICYYKLPAENSVQEVRDSA